MQRNVFFALIVVVIVLAGGAFVLSSIQQPQRIGVVGEIHWHADFAVFLNDTQFNFSQDKYMTVEPSNSTNSSPARVLSPFVHLHDLDGGVIHIHARGVTLGLFFKSLGMGLNSTCFVTDANASYCSAQDGLGPTLKLFVNGKLNRQFGDYQPQDLDKLLITYGFDADPTIAKQLAAISDRACIYSLKCPQKGTPPPEADCVGNSGGCKPA